MIHDSSGAVMETKGSVNVPDDCSRLECSDNVMDTTSVNSDPDDDYISKVKHDNCQSNSDLVDDKTEMCRYYTEYVNGDTDTLSDETESYTSSVSIDSDNCLNDNDKTCGGNDTAIVDIRDTGIESKQTDIDLCTLNEDDGSINRENCTSSINNAHSKISPYNICNYCGIQFESVVELNIHIKTQEVISSDTDMDYKLPTSSKDIRPTTDIHTVDIRRAYTELRRLLTDNVNKGLNSEIVASDDIPSFNTCLRKTLSDQENGSINRKSAVDDIAPFESDICNKVNRTVSSRCSELPSEQHSESPRNSCKYCGDQIDSVAEMNIHVKTHEKIVHGQVKYMYRCSICGTGCSGPSKLREHMYVHTREGPYMCVYCPKSFVRRVRLNKHIQVWHIEKYNRGGMYATGIQKEKYIMELNKSDTHVEHQLSISEKHDEENGGITKRTHPAAITPSASNIGIQGDVIHKVIPTSTQFAPKQPIESKPIESLCKKGNTCNYCGDAFDSVDEFSFHLKTHEKKAHEKFMYRCNICEKECDAYSKLKNHMLNVHSDIGEYKCMYCPQGFRQRSRLESHMERIHPDNNTDNDVKWDRNSDALENPVTTSFQESLNKSEVVTYDQIVQVQEKEIGNSNTEQDIFVENYMNQFSLETETVCTYCDARFGSLSTLRIHLKTHVRKCNSQFQFVYQCNICNTNFEKRCFMTNHRQLHSGAICVRDTGNTNSQFICGFCKKVITNMTELTKHLQTHISIKRYFQCKVCSRTFSDHKSLIQHKNDHDKDAVSSSSSSCTCDWCGKVFVDCRLFLELHILRHLRIKPYSCQICHTQFYRANRLKMHSYKHTGVSVFRCIMCVKSFGCSYTLRCHMKNTHGEMAFVCNFCPKMFLDAQALNKHLVDHRIMQNVCKICGKVCAQKYKLRMHMASHSDARPVQCKECPKTYKTVKSLQKHSLTHKPRNEIAIPCEVCGKSYSRSYIGLHMKFHSVKKKFNCDTCSKTFTLKHHLRNHLLSHDDTRNHICDICGYQFKMAHHMRSHMKIHTSSVGK